MDLKDADKKRTPVPRTSKPAPPWLGRRVGRFKLLAFLGQGGMGKVFRAEDVQLQRQVALKVLPLQVKLGDKTIGLEQFVREARSAAALEHPGVVQVYEVNQTTEVFYIAMELLEGGNLRDLVQASGPLDVVRACQLGAEAAEALGHAHQLGIVHRDVKPSNLMLSRGGRCKITDFGLARIDDPADTFYLGTEAVGTPLYMAPEVGRGQRADGAADIYSLAATMCYLLCGRPPFQARTAKEILDLHADEPPPDLCALRPDLPQSLSDAIRRGLAKRPKERFESAAQFASALRVHTIPLGASGAIPSPGAWGSAVGSGTWSGNPGVATQKPPVKSWLLRPGSLIAIGTIVILMIAGGLYYVFAPAPRTLPPAVDVIPPAPTPAVDNTPPPAPSPPPPAPVSTDGQAPATLSAADGATLLAIAKDPTNPLAGKPVTVYGVPNKSHLTGAGNLRLTFKGADEDTGFQIFCPSATLSGMKDRFGGANGSEIIGKKITVQGVISLYKGRPEIRIDSPEQISLSPP
jgi:serine/threonine protein kinase